MVVQLQVDRLYDWKTCPNAPIKDALSKQPKHVTDEFERRLSQVGLLPSPSMWFNLFVEAQHLVTHGTWVF